MNVKTFALSALLFAGLSTSAHALLIEPNADNEINGGNFNVTADINLSGNLDATDVNTLLETTDLTELYKSNFVVGTGLGDDEKSFAPYYDTTFSNFGETDPLNDPSDALIKWVAGSGTNFITCPKCYLLVKDGNQPQYLFDLGSWNGQVEIKLQGFYPDRGAISHVSIFGKAAAVEVTEPGTFALLGMGLLGFAMARRRIQK